MFPGLWVSLVLLRAHWSVSAPPAPLRRKGLSEQCFTAAPSRLPGPESQPPPRLPGFPGGAVVNSLPASGGGARDVCPIPGSGRPPGEGNGNPLQLSCLEHPVDRGAWRATVHGVAESNMTEPTAYTPPDRPVLLLGYIITACPGRCRVCLLSPLSHRCPHWLVPCERVRTRPPAPLRDTCPPTATPGDPDPSPPTAAPGDPDPSRQQCLACSLPSVFTG